LLLLLTVKRNFFPVAALSSKAGQSPSPGCQHSTAHELTQNWAAGGRTQESWLINI